MQRLISGLWRSVSLAAVSVAQDHRNHGKGRFSRFSGGKKVGTTELTQTPDGVRIVAALTHQTLHPTAALTLELLSGPGVLSGVRKRAFGAPECGRAKSRRELQRR
jgi:hypothetical protein